MVMSCSNKWEEEYIKEYNANNNLAFKSCNDYGQKYLHHYFNGTEWIVMCYQLSPCKVIEKNIGGTQ